MGWSKMVDMEMSDDSVLDALQAVPALPKPRGPQYPYGLRICLSSDDLKKLGLPTPDHGDTIDLRAFARVTSVSGDSPEDARVELQIEKLAVENEDDESA